MYITLPFATTTTTIVAASIAVATQMYLYSTYSTAEVDLMTTLYYEQ